MGYYIDFKIVTIDKYKEILLSTGLTKSRLILKENTDKIFAAIKKQNINNVEELQKTLKTKTKLQDFAEKSGIDAEYLTILIREINSNQQKPNRLKDFPNLSKDIVTKLGKLGIKTTLHVFERTLTQNDRKELSKQSGIDQETVLKLAKLADLSRIRWVNHTFAYMLHDTNYDTVEKVCEADFTKLHEDINNFNKEKGIYNGHIGINDIKLTIEAAKKISLDIQY